MIDVSLCPAALLASQAEQSGEPFLIHMLPSPRAIKKDAPGDIQLMEHFVKSPNYGVNSAAYHRVREIDWKMDCCRLPSIPHGADHGVQGYDEKLGSQVPRLWQEGDHCIEVGNLLCKCCFLVSSCVVLVSFFHCIVLFFFFCHYLYCCWNLICIVIVQWFIVGFFDLCAVCFCRYPIYMLRESEN